MLEWLQKVGWPITRPINSRQDHPIYALKNAKDIPALKAVCQNLMHTNLSITDGAYGVLSGMDVKGEITELGKKIISNESAEVGELKSLVKLLLLKLGERNAT